HVDERKLVVHTFERMKHNPDNLSIMVCPTYYCNFKCVYCVEETVKEQDIYMNDEVAHATIAWIKSYTESTRPKNLSLRFYGGEPLLNVPMMEFVSKEMFEYARSKGLKFVIGITTNGALLTEAVVDKLVPYGLKYVKITLDGDKEAHDKKRPYLSGKGTFDRIIKNIKAVSDKIMINIGGNFDEENADAMLRLLAFMKETGIGDKIGTFDFKPIMDTIDRRDAERTAEQAVKQAATLESLPDGMIPIDIPVLNDSMMPGCGSHSKAGSHSMSEGNIPEAYVTMKRAIAAHGFRTPPGIGQVACAMTMSETAFIVDPVGKIYNCPPLVGREQFSVGDVWNGLNHRFVEFMTLDVWRNDMCLDCTYVPMCGSGCRYEAYLKTGDIYAPDCEKAYFDKAVPELIKFDYEVIQAQSREQTDAFEERSFA
ncbi:MAG: SPASM domain-containing protein, partial [Candidatus Latescibacteria bacterium]|nr:SPASM domain-containing protein [Candidatus Latescibacterota bacterium]